MRSPRILPVALLGCSIALAACTLFTGPDTVRVVGVVEWNTSEPPLQSQAVHVAQASGQVSATRSNDRHDITLPVLEAPDTVRVGEPFDVIVRTYGSNGCWREAGAEVTISGLNAAVTPYDRDLAAEDRSRVCTDMVVRLPRTVRLRFLQEGEALLRVIGRRVVVGDEVRQGTGMAEIEHRLVVRQ